jgi:hypothetical protein
MGIIKNIINDIFYKFKKDKDGVITFEKEFREGYRIFKDNDTWGDRINSTLPGGNFKYGRHFYHTGWSPIIPKKGDMMLINMTSGKVAVTIFTNVRRSSSGVPDMFFAESKILGYKLD